VGGIWHEEKNKETVLECNYPVISVRNSVTKHDYGRSPRQRHIPDAGLLKYLEQKSTIFVNTNKQYNTCRYVSDTDKFIGFTHDMSGATHEW
jgi:hypothetical protein